MVAHSVRETAEFLGCPPDELIPLQNVTSGNPLLYIIIYLDNHSAISCDV
jgi:hypothetical protein